jgi:hypothetical protein
VAKRLATGTTSFVECPTPPKKQKLKKKKADKDGGSSKGKAKVTFLDESEESS